MDEIIAWLMKLLDFNTTAAGPDAESCASFISEVLSSKGVSVRHYTTEGTIRTAHHISAEVPGVNSDTVMLHAHLDTADFGVPDEWLFPAYPSTRRHGCICGRGAIDCKGPLAVWIKLLADTAQKAALPYTIRLLVSDLEEAGGDAGLGLLLAQRPELISDVKLVIGEGGGFPFPFQDKVYYTFQTGERDDDPEDPLEDPSPDQIKAILSMGIGKGYYSEDILTYAASADSLPGRRLDIRLLYSGMEDYFRSAVPSGVFAVYGALFTAALQTAIPDACLMPCITPGYSDNREFRKAGVPVIGFFPLDIRNSLRGIHGVNEYITEASLALAYRVMTGILSRLGSGFSCPPPA